MSVDARHTGRRIAAAVGILFLILLVFAFGWVAADQAAIH